MKDLSLQWRITLMTAALVCAACLSTNFLVGYSGMQYMDEIGSEVSAYGNVNEDIPKSFDPRSEDVGNELTIVVSDAQKSFGVTSWCITALVTLIGGVLAYFASGCVRDPNGLSPHKSNTCNQGILPIRKSARTCFRNSRGSANRSTA